MAAPADVAPSVSRPPAARPTKLPGSGATGCRCGARPPRGRLRRCSPWSTCSCRSRRHRLFSFKAGGRANTWPGTSSPSTPGPTSARPDDLHAVGTSLQIGVLATIVGVILGTLVAFALVRHRFRGRSATNLLIFLPMATPEVVSAPRCWRCSSTRGFAAGFGRS
jgi:hypothetical protein